MDVQISNTRDESWGETLAFWGALLIAGGLFAAVALAPKLETLAELKLRYAENQHRLVAMERQANELQSVADALEHDPAFASELAKLEFAAGRRGDESIAVAAELRLGGQRDAMLDATTPPNTAGSVTQAMLSPLANHRGLRIAMLMVAGGLV
ncbi:MAG: hypothetical protein M3552_23230, partial [Planctomycetota bacterium]|nr:hypothetical protein [Planctomycetota bacterium]